MKDPRRFFLFILCLVLVFCAVVLFRTFVYQNIIAPAAQLFWLAARILLSVDQKVYWTGLILLALLNAMRHVPWGTDGGQQALPPDPNAAAESVQFWRNWIELTVDQAERPNILKQNLLELAAAVQTSGQDKTAAYNAREAVKRGQLNLPGQIQLPPQIAGFLLAEAQTEASRALAGQEWLYLLRKWLNLPQQWLRKWTGRQSADYYKSIDEVLTYLEATLEMNHDDDLSHD